MVVPLLSKSPLMLMKMTLPRMQSTTRLLIPFSSKHNDHSPDFPFCVHRPSPLSSLSMVPFRLRLEAERVKRGSYVSFQTAACVIPFTAAPGLLYSIFTRSAPAFRLFL